MILYQIYTDLKLLTTYIDNLVLASDIFYHCASQQFRNTKLTSKEIFSLRHQTYL